VDRQTRHQLKHDEFKDSLVQIEEYFKQHYKEILTVVVVVVAVVGLAAGLKYYSDRQEAAANADLGEALTTFRAYVGQPTPEQNQPVGSTLNKYSMVPRPKAVAIARYQAGVCQSLLDDHSGAVLTLTEASQGHDAEIASLAKFALAGEMIKSGKTPEGIKLYQELADHPTINVPKASALLAMADAYRGSQPAKARQLYEQLQKDFVSNPAVEQAVMQQMATLAP
jgi:predicted negative regulator of RcsB-dependent stress response